MYMKWIFTGKSAIKLGKCIALLGAETKQKLYTTCSENLRRTFCIQSGIMTVTK